MMRNFLFPTVLAACAAGCMAPPDAAPVDDVTAGSGAAATTPLDTPRDEESDFDKWSSGASDGYDGMMDVVKVLQLAYEGPDPQDQLLDSLNKLDNAIVATNAELDELNAILDRVEGALVKDQNDEHLGRIRDWMRDMRKAIADLKVLNANRNDTAVRTDADIMSRRAAYAFTVGENFVAWRTVGPTLDKIRFDHRAALAPFLEALGVRLGYLRFAAPTKAALIANYQQELLGYADFVKSIEQQIDGAITCEAHQFTSGTWGSFTCGVSAKCTDNVRRIDRTQVSDTTCIGGGTFDPNFFTDPVRAQLAGELRKPLLADLEHMLRNLAWYGQPGDPVPVFGGLHIALRMDTNAVDGTDPTDGARPQLKPWSETAATERWVQEHDGTLRNETTGKCLEVYGWSQDKGAAITTWSCHGGANQQWTVVNGNVFKNVNSGQCLTDQVLIFRFGTHWTITHSLVQDTCDGRAAQSWKTATRDVPPPR